MKKTLLAFAAALALASCSKEELVPGGDQLQNAVAFNTYVGSSAQTRATVVNTSYIEVNGFGVNAYYTGTSNFDAETDYSAENNAVFMDNTKVSFNSEKGEWTYSPIKYWPNNSGDMLSFFAYAPYNSSQINFDTQNRSKLSFSVDADVKNQVDLIYHPANGNEEKGCEKTIDLTKPSVTSKVSFNFQHALSRITFDVKAVVDEVNADGDNLLDGNTRVNIKKVALVNTDADYETTGAEGSFYTTGVLNLADGTWAEEGGEQGFEFDGSNFYRSVEDNGETVAQLTKFNPAQILLAEDSYLMIIPQDFSADGYRIYIEYDVISEEINNNGSNENTTNDGNTITNKIYSQALTTNFEAGKAYKFTLLLGMTSVKFDAQVADWEDANNEDEQQWMPENTEEEEESTKNYELVATNLMHDGNNNIIIATTDNLTEARTYINGGNQMYLDPDDSKVYYLKYNESVTAEEISPDYDYFYNGNYTQTADIDLSTSSPWTPIGTSTTKFKGTYSAAKADGGNYTISNLTITEAEADTYVGLFGYCCDEVEISNITMTNVKIGSETTYINGYAGAIVGYTEQDVYSPSISSCIVESGDIYAKNAAGIAYGENTTNVTKCTNKANIYAENQGAGIVVDINNGSVIDCTNYGNITCSNGEASGIVDEARYAVTNCHNKGDISGTSAAGIVSGGFYKVIKCSNTGTITATNMDAGGIIASNSSIETIASGCWNGGIVKSAQYAGGIVGSAESKINITGCYNTRSVSSDNSNYAGGIIGYMTISSSGYDSSVAQTFTGCYTNIDMPLIGTAFLPAPKTDDEGNVTTTYEYRTTFSGCYYVAENAIANNLGNIDTSAVTKVETNTLSGWADGDSSPLAGLNTALTDTEFSYTKGDSDNHPLKLQ